MPSFSFDPKAIDAYYEDLGRFAAQDVCHEQAVRLPFSTLLSAVGKRAGWTLVLEKSLSNRARPDGTLQDSFRFPRGYWESKDTQDDLKAEIQKKIARGYPLTNTIFEDTQQAVLYQNNRPLGEFNLKNPHELKDLLSRFFAYTGEQIEEFHAAVNEFQTRIPELARHLQSRIEEERKQNKAFVAAFEEFHTLCKGALNPSISAESIEEMLVQHLLTERLFRTVFDNPDFTRRNVIAEEIEKVIDALTSRAFSRKEFLKQLDYFYLAIEDAARTIQDYSEKQAFLNTVYERFFQGFSKQQADTHGIVYTPQAIVDFMVASVDEVLRTEFGKSLSSPGVCILDPCVGTGNFIVNILRRIDGSRLKQKYENELFCNEIMLLPYYIASLNIEHAYYERTGEYAPYKGVCFTDTLTLVEGPQTELALFSEENTERVMRQKASEIKVVVGNPPYNVGQANENDNNKNRRYPAVDERIKDTYAKDSKATLNTKLYDPYVKFFRWATDRLRGQDGIVCFVSNNSFVDQTAFDGMRKHLLENFDQIYHIDLHGNVRKNPKLSGTTHNVFGIQVGVGITLAIRNRNSTERFLRYYRMPEDWRKEEKLGFLLEKSSINGIEWIEKLPNYNFAWLTEGLRIDFERFVPLGTKISKATSDIASETIFHTYSLGINTQRDAVVYNFQKETLQSNVKRFIEDYNLEVSRWSRRDKSNTEEDIDKFVTYDNIKWSRNLKRNLRGERFIVFEGSLLKKSQYRPYTIQWLYHARFVIDELGITALFFPTPWSESENVAICLTVLGSEKPFMALITNIVPDLHLVGAGAGAQCFPFYTYDEDGGNRRENITDWALAQYQALYGADVTKWDIFHYVYAVLHHPHYRARYAENLKRELPRIPFVADSETFRRYARIGARLADLHLNYETADEYPLQRIENNAVPFSWRVTKMRLSKDKDAITVNESLTLAGLPEAAFRYRLGNRSAVEWVIDQYQVRTDPRSGITSDPNRDDDPEYIVRLIGQVAAVSVETVRLIEELGPELPIIGSEATESGEGEPDG